ncbi:MAG: penicillin-binding protein activator LpoB [Flavobacteriales bacterium]|nr:penicillin-binding protein activator LpoB [Flavobacteriales bacterium]
MKQSCQPVLLIIFLLFSQQSFAQNPDKDFRDMEKYYEQGNYVDATQKAISFLRVRPTKKKAQEILATSFNMAMEDLRIEISDLKERSRSFSGDATVNDRRKIMDKYKLMRELDRGGREIVRVIPKQKVPLEFDRVNVSTELEAAQKSLDEAIELAAEMHYKEGLRLKENQDRESQKNAAKKFKAALNYVANYKDCDALYSTARKNAITRVAILPFINKSGVTQYGDVGEMTSDKLRAGILNNDAASEFIEIITRDQLDVVIREHNLNRTNDIIDQSTIAAYGKVLGIHLILTGKVMQVAVEHRQTIHDGARASTKRVITGTRNYTDSKGVKRSESIWGEVTAQNYYHHKTAFASMNGSYELIDVQTGRLVTSGQFRETKEWENHWSTYTGDQLAAEAPRGYDSGEMPTPSKSELAIMVMERLGTKISSDVINFIK